MKSLDSLVDSLRLRSSIQNRVVLGEPWGVAFPPTPPDAKVAKFHFIELGSGILTVPGQTPALLQRGDLAIVFSDAGHTVQDTGGTPPTELCRLLEEADIICTSGLTLRFGGDGAQTSVISGNFCFADASAHPLWRMLPPFILLPGQDGQAAEWLDTTLDLLSREAMAVRPGVRPVLDRLCDVLFIQALRGWVRGDGGSAGWPAAVRDPAIDDALDLMQRHPAEPWTLETLARRVALSRSTFAERFHRLTGEPPMEYLARWRMHRAAQLLSDDAANVAAIAAQVGYDSEAAFARAFKRRIGVAPGAYRRLNGDR